MKTTKLETILLALTAAKKNRFLKFLASPYFNVNNDILGLVKLIITLQKTNKQQQRQEVFSSLFGETEYNDLKLRKLYSDSVAKFEDFLVFEAIKDNKLAYHELLLEQIHFYQLDIIQDKAKNNAITYYKRHPEKASEYYVQKYKLEKNIFNLSSEYEKKKIKKGGKRNLNIQQLNHDLDTFYVIEKLRLACDLIAWQRIFKINDRPFDIEVILRMLDRNELLSNPIVKAYRSAYLMLIGKEAKLHYEALKEITFGELNTFPSLELKEIFDSMLTFCIGKFGIDGKFYLFEALKLYDFGIEEEIILKEGFITPVTFRNYVVIGLRVNLFDKIEDFIDSKAYLLSTIDKDNTVNFCRARLFWYKKEWKKVIQQLAIVNFEDSGYYYRNSRIMQVSAYYELKEFDTIDYTLDAFYGFLIRNKDLSENVIKPYKSYISYTRKLIKVHPGDKNALLKLKQMILADPSQINGKDWLLEKIEEQLSL